MISNYKDGIRYQWSHAGTISTNTLKDNDQNPKSGCTPNGREITVADSDHVSVTGNTITSNCAGITLSGFQPNETIVPVDDVVTDNTTTYSRSGVVANAIGGIDGINGAKSPLFHPANNNYYDYNTYHFNSTSLLNLKNWMWNGSKNWSQWRAAGQDTHSTAN